MKTFSNFKRANLSFDIDEEDYEDKMEDFIRSLKKSTVTAFKLNLDLAGWRVLVEKEYKVVIFADPTGESYVYKAKEIKEYITDNLLAYVIDDSMWVYYEFRTNMESFGMDMTMPFLQSLCEENLQNIL